MERGSVAGQIGVAHLDADFVAAVIDALVEDDGSLRELDLGDRGREYRGLADLLEFEPAAGIAGIGHDIGADAVFDGIVDEVRGAANQDALDDVIVQIENRRSGIPAVL